MSDPTDEEFVTAAFSDLESVEASANLRRRVAQIPIEVARKESSLWPFARAWQSLSAFAALGALGLVVGNFTHAPMNTESQSANRQGIATELNIANTDSESEDEDPLEGLFALALAEDWEDWEREAIQ